MSNAVRVTTELISSARKSGGRMGRSIAQQIDYWARLGRSFEQMPSTSLARIEACLSGKGIYDLLSATEQPAVLEEWGRMASTDGVDQSLYQELLDSGVPFTDVDEKGRRVRVTPDGARQLIRPLKRVK